MMSIHSQTTRRSLLKPVAAAAVYCGLLAASGGTLRAGDWPQWRGPNRDGIVQQSPQLAEAWPKGGPPTLWQSDPLPGGDAAGFGSPVVAGGKVYVFAAGYPDVPVPTRVLAERELRRLGWFPERPPEELVAKIEQARVREDRAALRGLALSEWIGKWIEDNLNEEQRKRFKEFADDRLRRGADAFGLADLDRLAEIKDKTFDTQESFDKWLAQSGLSEKVKQEVVRRVPTTEKRGQDIIVCFSAADGKTVWKKEYPGHAYNLGTSGTPCVAGGRVYVVGSAGAFYCLDAEKGEEIWRAKVGGERIFHHDLGSVPSCSPIVMDGLVIAPIGPLVALDAATGSVKWTQAKVEGTHCSPVAWEKGGRKYVVCNTFKKVFCADARTGEIAWEAPGGKRSTPVIQGDTMLLFSDNPRVGLTAYRLSPDKAEPVWTIESFTDAAASPLVHEGYVYAVGWRGALCVELESGKEVWRGKPEETGGNLTSPILADGKVYATAPVGDDRVSMMLKAGPAGCTVLAKANLGLLFGSSAAFFDGKLLVRTKQAVRCFDLTGKGMPKPSTPSAATSGGTPR